MRFLAYSKSLREPREDTQRRFGRSRTSGTLAPARSQFRGHGSGGQFLGGFQAGDCAVFAQGHHDREQAGRDSLAGQHDACAVDQRAGFHLFFCGEVTQQSFGSGFGESFFGRGVAFAQFHQQPADSFIRAEIFRPRRDRAGTCR